MKRKLQGKDKEFAENWIEVISNIVGEDKLMQGFFLKFKPPKVMVRLQKRLILNERKKLRKGLKQGLRKQIIRVLDQSKCCHCGKELTFQETNLRYLIPLEKGGKTELKNIITVCKDCGKRRTLGSFAVKAEDIHNARRDLLYDVMNKAWEDMYARMAVRKLFRIIEEWLEKEKN